MTHFPDVSTPLWTVHREDTVASTNEIAGRLPAWHAVTALRQTQGRGRYRRHWVSDEGGLWVSAVLPTPGSPLLWSVLPLAAGWALRNCITQLGVEGLHLRWPNDLLLGSAKLAGILVERFNPECAVVGIGINVSNNPGSEDTSLSGAVTRLVDLLSPLPHQDFILASLLAHLAQAQEMLAAGRISALLPELNAVWHIKRVHITLPGERFIEGEFLGVDAQGNLLVKDRENRQHTLSPMDVTKLREA